MPELLSPNQPLHQSLETRLRQSIALVEEFVDRQYLADLPSRPVAELPAAERKIGWLSFYKVDRFVYDPAERIDEKLVSVYSALCNFGSTLLLLLDSDGVGADLYLGTRDDTNPDVSGNLLRRGLEGQFPGMLLQTVDSAAIQGLMARAFPEEYARKSLSSVCAVPGRRGSEADAFVQGIDKLIETMAGNRYTALFVCRPLERQALRLRRQGYEEMHTALSAFERMNVSFTQSQSLAVAEGVSQNFTRTVGNSISLTHSTSTGTARGKTQTAGSSSSFTLPLLGFGSGSSRSSATSKTRSTADTTGRTDTASTADSDTSGRSSTQTQTGTNTGALSLDLKNRRVCSLLEKIDTQIGRIEACEAFGMWDCAAYFAADSQETAAIAANTYKALVSGENTGVEEACISLWRGESDDGDQRKNTVRALQSLHYGHHPEFEVENTQAGFVQRVTATSGVSGAELPVFAGLPQKSVSGLTAIASAEFGRNVVEIGPSEGRRSFPVGQITHMGRVRQGERVTLKANTLAAHTLVTGSSGSGKSNTVCEMLNRLAALTETDGAAGPVKFLVIEPAKGEYKAFFGPRSDVTILTTAPDDHDTLRLNPFSFPKEISVLEHMDQLIEIFSACWPLYAAMPAILKAAFERAYQGVGWELKHSVYLGEGTCRFPTFYDVLHHLPQIIRTSDYSAQSKGDYTGALVTRVRSLTTGSMGSIFCDEAPLPDELLFDQNVVVDLSRVKSTETSALIMGLLVLKLGEHRAARAGAANRPLSHVTVLEEAHNLLPRVDTAQGQEAANPQGKSVEMLCKAIAEMRTYGEGFIIADQTPSALADAALANTSTKIIMRLSKYEDCQSAGHSIGLHEAQIREIGKLGRGMAVVYQSNWLEPVLALIGKAAPPEGAATHKTLPFEEKRALLAEVFEEALQQRGNQGFNARWMLDILHVPALSGLEQARYSRLVSEYCALAPLPRQKAFSAFAVALLECGELPELLGAPFNGAAPPEKLSPKNRQQAEKWGERLRTLLRRFTGIEDARLLGEALKCLLFHAAETSERSDIRVAASHIIGKL